MTGVRGIGGVRVVRGVRGERYARDKREDTWYVVGQEWSGVKECGVECDGCL